MVDLVVALVVRLPAKVQDSQLAREPFELLDWGARADEARVEELDVALHARERIPVGIDRDEDHLSYVLGDLTRRIFVGTQFVPPDELLEEVAETLRDGKPAHLHKMAIRLRDHARHLEEVAE